MNVTTTDLKPITFETVLGPIRGLERSRECSDFQIFSDFPRFKKISGFIFDNKEIDFVDPKIRFISITMPLVYKIVTIQKIKQFIESFFEKMGEEAPCFLFIPTNRMSPRQPKWVIEIQEKVEASWKSSVGIEEKLLGDFSEIDLRTLGYTKNEIKIINNRFKDQNWEGRSLALNALSCFQYALLKTKARGVKEQLFTPVDPRDGSIILRNLKKWGYRIVQSPQIGDLVLYFKNGIPMHMAYYNQDHQVESKCGNFSSQLTIHPLHLIYHEYGSQIAFFRKDPSEEGRYDEECVIEFVYKKPGCN